MPEKDPWKRPKTNAWIKIGKKIVFNNGRHPREAPVWIITKIETTGNGARMVHLTADGDPDVVTAKWEAEILGRDTLSGVRWMPVPPKPRAPRPKKERKSRFDREDPI